jgi:hypothetical protein
MDQNGHNDDADTIGYNMGNDICKQVLLPDKEEGKQST